MAEPDLVAIARDLVAVLDRHKVPADARLSFLVGIPVGVLKAQGVSDQDVRKFVDSTLAGALSTAKTTLAGAAKPAAAKPSQVAAKPGAMRPGQGKVSR